MAKEVRFPRKMETWVPDWLADEFDALAREGMLTSSDHRRQAYLEYVFARRARSAPGPAATNGAHSQHLAGA